MSQFPVYRVADLAQNSATAFEIVPKEAQLKAIAKELGLDGLRKMRFKGDRSRPRASGIGNCRALWAPL